MQNKEVHEKEFYNRSLKFNVEFKSTLLHYHSFFTYTVQCIYNILGVAFSGHSQILSVALLCAAVGANGFIYSGEMAAIIGKFYVYLKGCVIVILQISTVKYII